MVRCTSRMLHLVVKPPKIHLPLVVLMCLSAPLGWAEEEEEFAPEAVPEALAASGRSVLGEPLAFESALLNHYDTRPEPLKQINQLYHYHR
jgi:hypothetical protein